MKPERVHVLAAGGALLSALHLASAEVLQEVGEALDDAAVFGAVPGGVAEEDFGAGPGPLGAQRCALIGRLAAFFIQLAVDVLCSTRGSSHTTDATQHVHAQISAFTLLLLATHDGEEGGEGRQNDQRDCNGHGADRPRPGGVDWNKHSRSVSRTLPGSWSMYTHTHTHIDPHSDQL